MFRREQINEARYQIVFIVLLPSRALIAMLHAHGRSLYACQIIDEGILLQFPMQRLLLTVKVNKSRERERFQLRASRKSISVKLRNHDSPSWFLVCRAVKCPRWLISRPINFFFNYKKTIIVIRRPRESLIITHFFSGLLNGRLDGHVKLCTQRIQ